MPSPHQKKTKKTKTQTKDALTQDLELGNKAEGTQKDETAKKHDLNDLEKIKNNKKNLLENQDSEPIMKISQDSDKQRVDKIETKNEHKNQTNPKNNEKNNEKVNQITSNSKKSESDKSEKAITPISYAKIMLSIFLVASMGLTVFVNSYLMPQVILQNTDSAIAARAKKEADEKIAQVKAEKAKKIETENKIIKFTDQKVDLNIKDFGSIKINLNDKAAPKTVENFVRLTYRKYFDGTVFHRMVKSPTFSVIQGGDPKGSDPTTAGTGGETASGEPLVDELWKVKPQSDPQRPGEFLNTPEFREPSLYKDFDVKTGEVTYIKGQILMAKTSAPDSATSQFFITLADTKLPADYTVFGTVDSDSFAILDKIFNEVEPSIDKPLEGAPENYKDGRPNKELKIETLTLL